MPIGVPVAPLCPSLAMLDLHDHTFHCMYLQVVHHTQHLVILDAGSTGTRVHVFRYVPAKAPLPYAAIHLPEAKLKVEPGLSSYAAEPAAGAASLGELLDFAYR